MQSRLRLVFIVCSIAACGVLIALDVSPRATRASAVESMSCCQNAQSEIRLEDSVNSKSPAPLAQEADAEDPAKQSEIRTDTSVVRGKVQIGGNLDLQRPDLTRVVIFLQEHPALKFNEADLPFVTVAQKNKSFVPNFAAVARGTTIEFPKWDDFDHNVFSRSKAAPAFDLDRYPKGQSKSRVFEKVGVVQIFCNIHPQMRAIIYVTPNRCFTRAQADGTFEIRDIPPGQYEVVAWHERCGDQRQSVELLPGKPSEIEFTLQENRQQIIANDPPKKDQGYGIERGLGVKREKLNLPVVKESHPARSAPPK